MNMNYGENEAPLLPCDKSENAWTENAVSLHSLLLITPRLKKHGGERRLRGTSASATFSPKFKSDCPVVRSIRSRLEEVRRSNSRFSAITISNGCSNPKIDHQSTTAASAVEFSPKFKSDCPEVRSIHRRLEDVRRSNSRFNADAIVFASPPTHHHLQHGGGGGRRRNSMTSMSLIQKSWLDDTNLVKSKVFQAHVTKCAVRIQSIVRRAIQRGIYMRTLSGISNIRASSVRIQAAYRGWRCRVMYRRTLRPMSRATIRVQAFYRGWRCRMHLHLNRLTCRLNQINKQRQKELDDSVRHRYEAMGLEMEFEFKIINRTIDRLRASNKRHRSDLSKLTAANEKLNVMNADLRQSSRRFHRESMRKAMHVVQMEETTETWKCVEDKACMRVFEWTNELEIIEHRLHFEREMHALHAKTVERIISHMAQNCTDESLKEQILGFSAALPYSLDEQQRSTKQM